MSNTPNTTASSTHDGNTPRFPGGRTGNAGGGMPAGRASGAPDWPGTRTGGPQPEDDAAGCCVGIHFIDYICLNCHWFDSSYHDGYCDYHRKDTKPTNSCYKFRE